MKFNSKFFLFSCIWLACWQAKSQEMRVIDNKGSLKVINNIRVISQTTQPATIDSVEGDVWFDTDEVPIIPRIYDGTTWKEIDPKSITGSVLFAGASGGVAEKNTEFFWDNTNNRLGVGTNSPSQKLDVVGNISVSGGFLDSSGDIGTTGQLLSSTGTLTDWVASNTFNWGLTGNASTDPIINFLGTTDAQDLVFRTNNTEKARILSNGNVNMDAGTLFVDAANNRIGLGTTTPTEFLSLNGNDNRVINVERNLFSGGPGRHLSIIAGGASTIGNNKKGGNLILSSGISTGDQSSRIMFRTATAGVSGNSDNNPTTKMTILDSGNVGIGTNSPTSKLQVEGDIRVSGGFLDSSGDIGTANQVLSSTGTLTDWVASNTFNWGLTGNASTDPSLNFLGTTDALDLVFRTNNTEKARILSNGNVGINTTNPTSKLQVEGDIRVSGGFLDSSGDIGTAGQVFSSTGTLTDWVAPNTFSWGVTGNASTDPTINFLGTTDAQDLVFKTNNTEKARILSNGNVGIGITNPTQKLEVASGSLFVNAEGSAIVNDFGTYSRLGFAKKSGRLPVIASGKAYPILLGTWSSDNLLGNIASGDFQERVRIASNGNVGIGLATTTGTSGSNPSQILSLGGTQARTINVERHPTSNTAGSNLTILAGGANNSAATIDKNGGALILSSGNAKGNGSSIINLRTATAGASGSADITPSTKMTILGNGNVGIGTTAPTSLLHVVGNTNLQGNLNVTGGILDSSGDIGAIGDVLSSTATGTSWISLAAASSLDWSRIGNDSTDPTINFLGTTDAQDLVFRSNNIEKMRLFSLTTNPYIGIGRNSLTGVNGGASSYSGPTLFFGDLGNISSSTGMDFIIDDDNNATNTRFTFKTNGDGALGTVDLMEISENGNVGIGTTSAPTQKLEVIGNVYVNAEGSAIVNDVGQSRLGFVKKSGSLPVIASGSGSPILLGTWSTPNLLGNIASGSFTERVRIASTGDVGIGTGGDPTAKLDINGDKMRLRTPKTPATATETCKTGDIVWDTNYIYVCVAPNIWKRSALSTW